MLASATSELLPTSVVEFRTSFRRRFVKFRQLQAQYQPEVASLLCWLPATSMDPPSVHDTPFYLPSSLPPDVLSIASERLVFMEKELRLGQCRDSLNQLRTRLVAKTRLIKYKYVNVRHQAPNTRSRGHLNQISTKIDAAVAKYRHAFAALQVLDQSGKSEWRSKFRELRDQDVRGLSEPELPNARTRERAEELQARSLLNGGAMPEGNRTVSWIWRGSIGGGPGEQGRSDEYGEGLFRIF